MPLLVTRPSVLTPLLYHSPHNQHPVPLLVTRPLYCQHCFTIHHTTNPPCSYWSPALCTVNIAYPFTTQPTSGAPSEAHSCLGLQLSIQAATSPTSILRSKQLEICTPGSCCCNLAKLHQTLLGLVKTMGITICKLTKFITVNTWIA